MYLKKTTACSENNNFLFNKKETDSNEVFIMCLCSIQLASTTDYINKQETLVLQ